MSSLLRGVQPGLVTPVTSVRFRCCRLTAAPYARSVPAETVAPVGFRLASELDRNLRVPNASPHILLACETLNQTRLLCAFPRSFPTNAHITIGHVAHPSITPYGGFCFQRSSHYETIGWHGPVASFGSGTVLAATQFAGRSDGVKDSG